MILEDAQDKNQATEEYASKSARKRHAQELQDLGKRLAALKPDVLAGFDLPDAVVHALHEYNRFKSNEARRRQLQFIGKQMRQLDTAPIIAQLGVVDGHAVSVKQALHQLERWRERLLADDSSLTEFIDAYPATDRQQLRAMVRKARQEQQRLQSGQQSGQAHPHAKALLRHLRQICSTSADHQA